MCHPGLAERLCVSSSPLRGQECFTKDLAWSVLCSGPELPALGSCIAKTAFVKTAFAKTAFGHNLVAFLSEYRSRVVPH